MGLFLCIVAASITFVLGRAHLTAGLGSVLVFGYGYGILRANYLDGFAHFIFDCAVAGFYLSIVGQINFKRGSESQLALLNWTTALLAWAVLMFLIPIQHFFIQLVGLRGNAFLIPFIFIGAWMQPKDFNRLAIWMAALNLVALVFGLGEYLLGVPSFYPDNQVTKIIYNSQDVANGKFRIPATFVNAHTYAGTMVSTIPWLIGALTQESQKRWRWLIVLGILAALLGVFMTATRVGIGVLALLIGAATFSRELKGGFRFGWIGLLGIVIFVVTSEERMQRFLSIQDKDKVIERIEGSVNITFVDLLLKYPFGTGMGAGGTSLPFFLQHYLKESVMIENEYGRILLEQGIGGLVLWIGFIGWLLTRPPPRPGSSWMLGWRLMWWLSLGTFVLALLGTGLMTAIPCSVTQFLAVGVVAAYTGDPVRRLKRRSSAAPLGARAQGAVP